MRELVEKSRWDSFWGNGRDKKGRNMLGKLHMKLRAEYLEEKSLKAKL